MDRVRFDEDGLMSCTVTDSPQPAPGHSAQPGAKTSIPVTINKMVAMNALSKASSQQDGWPAAYAVDDYSGTIWRPATDDAQPQLTIEISRPRVPVSCASPSPTGRRRVPSASSTSPCSAMPTATSPQPSPPRHTTNFPSTANTPEGKR